ncbi:uncharacterized protein LOC126264397 [Aethina tumida]|uniref:uncharacterized protein LOC126264397 n=1 Tax=Aethina tumida TaxID=116153 RepID=UPI0021491F73|nr:uncharacterized protein LOC126264397 [Aethina tumida]
MNGRKEFKPLKYPRCPLTKKNILTAYHDLKQYNDYLRRLFYAKSRVDSKPPKFDCCFPRSSAMKDYKLCQANMRENQILLRKLDCIWKRPNRYMFPENESKLREDRKKWDKLRHDNIKLYEKIKAVRSGYEKKRFFEEYDRQFKVMNDMAIYPWVLKEEIKYVESLPSLTLDRCIAGTERQMCRLQFREVSGRVIGTIYFELYSGAVPNTVKTFIFIMNYCYDRHIVNAIKIGKYLEIKDSMVVKKNVSIRHLFVQDRNVLSNLRAGVLSLTFGRKEDCRFRISFKSDELQNRYSIPFAKVVKGLEILHKMEGYGRRIGKPYVDIQISSYQLF